MAFIAGPYTWTLGSVSGPLGAVFPLGTIEDAPSLELPNNNVDPIRGDNLGDATQDGVFRAGDCFLNLVLQEYNALGAKYAFAPYAVEFGMVGCVGSLMSEYADELIGTPLSPGCTLGAEATKTFLGYRAVLAPGFPIRLLMGSRLRNVPLRFQLLPFEYQNVRRYFRFYVP
jgi:hypothetical protein